jgi:microcystin-dependent protein
MAQVANKDIANSSGAGVRADLNLALAAVASNNFGDKAQAGQVLPCELVADSSTTPKKLLIRSTTGDDGTSGTTPTYFDVGNLDEANLGLVKRAGDTLTGPLLVDDSSGASSPALSFDGDSDTGIFRQAANTMGFSTAGTQRVGISNAGLDMLNALPIRFQDSSGSPFVSIQSPSSLSGNVTLTLPSSITNGGFLQTDGSGNLSFQIVAGVPTGSVFCLAVDTVPTGYVKCNGASYQRTGTYAALFAVIGTTYGAADSSHFNVPDLRGEFVRGFDDGRGVDSGRSINDPQGGQNLQHNHTASSSVTDPGHFHHSFKLGNAGQSRFNSTLSSNVTPASGTGAANLNEGYNIVSRSEEADVGKTSSKTTGVSVNTNTDNQGSEARPRNIAMLYIIKI